MFSSKSLILLDLMFRPLIHFELYFLHIMLRQGSDFTVLHVAVHLFQNYLLKGSSSPTEWSWKSVDQRCMWLFLDSYFCFIDSYGSLQEAELAVIEDGQSWLDGHRWNILQKEFRHRVKHRIGGKEDVWSKTKCISELLLALRYHTKPQSH